MELNIDYVRIQNGFFIHKSRTYWPHLYSNDLIDDTDEINLLDSAKTRRNENTVS